MALRRGIWSKLFVTWFLKFSDANKHALGWSDHAGIVQNHRLCNNLKGYETNSHLPYKINYILYKWSKRRDPITLSEDDWGVPITSWAKYLGSTTILRRVIGSVGKVHEVGNSSKNLWKFGGRLVPTCVFLWFVTTGSSCGFIYCTTLRSQQRFKYHGPSVKSLVLHSPTQ